MSQGYWKRSYRGKEPPEHGKLQIYTNYGCRCQHCRAAMAAYQRQRRAAIKAGRLAGAR